MNQATFSKFQEIVRDKSGIALRPGKEALVAARISKRMRVLGIADHGSYLRHVIKDESGEEIIHLLDVISTNVTNFFREAHHFDFVRDAVGKWIDQGCKRLRFWCAACSSGEEPYTLAMTLLETVKNRKLDIKILATDISITALGRGRAGVYEEKKMQGVPVMLRQKYFDAHGNGDEKSFSVKPVLKNMIVFKRFNLSVTPFPMRGPMDIVFCRNVMIYFDQDVRNRLIGEICRLLKPGGNLMVGHAEGLVGLTSGLKNVKPSIYVKPA